MDYKGRINPYIKMKKTIIAIPSENVEYVEALRIYNVNVTSLVEEIINELESNPNKDGSISPNIQHFIEQKKSQLRKKFLTP